MSPKFKICSQVLSHPSKKTLIIFQQIGRKESIIQSVDQLISAENLLSGFSQTDIDLLNYIAESERDLEG